MMLGIVHTVVNTKLWLKIESQHVSSNGRSTCCCKSVIAMKVLAID